MKRLFPLLLLAALLLTACGGTTAPEPYTEMINDVTYFVDPANQVITVNGWDFSYTQSQDKISIEYPNGAVYTEVRHDYNDYVSTVIRSGWDNMGDPQISPEGNEYANCHDLIYVVPEYEEKVSDDPYAFKLDIKMLFLAIISLVMGIYGVSQPEQIWKCRFGWHFKNAEPSEMSLGLIVFGGIILIITGVISLILAFL